MATGRGSRLLVVCALIVTVGAVVVVVRWQHRDPVLMVGDSMAAIAGNQLRDEGDSVGYSATVDAHLGIRLAERLDALQQAADSGAKRVVVELGTNDVLQKTPTASLDELIDKAVTILQPVPCVVFVNVGILAGPVELADHFNQHLRDDLEAHPNEHEYDWSSVYHQHPDWSADGVHLQTPYLQSYAHGLIEAVHGFCR